MEIAYIYISHGHKDPSGECHALTIMASIIDFQELLRKRGGNSKKRNCLVKVSELFPYALRQTNLHTAKTKGAKQIYTGWLEEINGNLDRQSLRQAIRLNKNVKIRNLNDFKVIDRRVDGLYYVPNVLEESSYNSFLK